MAGICPHPHVVHVLRGKRLGLRYENFEFIRDGQTYKLEEALTKFKTHNYETGTWKEEMTHPPNSLMQVVVPESLADQSRDVPPQSPASNAWFTRDACWLGSRPDVLPPSGSLPRPSAADRPVLSCPQV